MAMATKASADASASASASSPRSATSSFKEMFDDLIARGRATEEDLGRATKAIASGDRTEESLVSEWAPLGLEIGATVRLKGLKKRADLNGLEATVITFARSRFGLELSGRGKKIAAKRENITEVPTGVEFLIVKLGLDLANLVGTYLLCTRCSKPCTIGSKCRVEHPADLRRDLGAMSNAEGMQSHFSCGACNQNYSILTPWSRNGGTGEPRIVGDRWCYAGVCTTIPLPPTDKRRVISSKVALKPGPGLQEEIDALPADTEILTIMSEGFYDDSITVSLERHLPLLTNLQLVDVCFDKIVLNEVLTPSLQHLRMQNVPDECDLTIEAPELKSVSIHFLGGCDRAINIMLAHATKLQSFDSYKLWVNELHFASNDLVSVDLHRSDSLGVLELYAPNLESLSLQACYGLEDITFRQSHPTLSTLLPSDHFPPPLSVNTVNANLGHAARMALRDHPTAGPSHFRHPGMATESIFANMSGGGSEDPWWEDEDDVDVPPGFIEMWEQYPEMRHELVRMMSGMGGVSGDDDDYEDDDDYY